MIRPMKGQRLHQAAPRSSIDLDDPGLTRQLSVFFGFLSGDRAHASRTDGNECGNQRRTGTKAPGEERDQFDGACFTSHDRGSTQGRGKGYQCNGKDGGFLLESHGQLP